MGVAKRAESKQINNPTRAWQEKNLVDECFPFNLFIVDDVEFPPHWHEEFEIVYMLEDSLTMGVNSEIYNLKPRDILLVSQGEVHYFQAQPRQARRIIVQFTPAILESFAPLIRNCRFATPLIKADDATSTVHCQLEQQILMAQAEYRCKQEGFQLAIKARLFDLVTILWRQVPIEKCSVSERDKQMQNLSLLEQVVRYVETNFTQDISLAEVAAATGFSVYHFARFFKTITGMTFIQYYNHFRIAKVVSELNNTNDSLTAIAFRSGFNSIQTFNRVFKELKGCSPSSYKKQSRS
jgi:AraC-like DNA-binding protein